MKKQITCGLIHGTIFILVIGFGGTSSVLADEPAVPSPTIQGETEPSADAEAVQERGIRRMPFSGRTVGKIDINPVGFSCDAQTKTCTCRKSKTGDCKLMKALVCSGAATCPGSSQTCTCTAIR